MSTTTNTDDSSIEQSEEDEEYDWSVEEGGFRLAKFGLDYYLEFRSFSVEFRGIREEDDGYELRNRNHRSLGTFNPDGEDVPETIGIAFRVLAEEI